MYEYQKRMDTLFEEARAASAPLQAMMQETRAKLDQAMAPARQAIAEASARFQQLQQEISYVR